MATNKYFDHLNNTAEQDLIESMVVETIQMSGMDIHYMPREHMTDDVLREPVSSNFTSTWTIEAYFHDVAGFGGQGDFMSKFGFQQMDTIEVSIAKKSWRNLNVTGRENRPREGDVIYLPFSRSFFEIAFVEHEDPFWQLGRYNTFKLKCNMYTRGYNEKFSTPLVDINNGANADNASEIDAAINNAVTSKSNVLLDFTEKNPFSDF